MIGEEIKSFSHKHIVKSVDFSHDSKSLLTGSNEKILRIFDLESYDTGKLINLIFAASSFRLVCGEGNISVNNN